MGFMIFSKKRCSRKKVTFYIHWLNKFTVFYPQRLARVTRQDIQCFLDKLPHEGTATRRIDRAGHTIRRYIVQYCGKMILSESLLSYGLKKSGLKRKAKKACLS
jgi:hypothetical protein